MSQHDYVIDNASGATVRADINSALGAIQSLNSGTSEPSSTAAGMLWLDTTGGAPYALKVRDAGNNHWLTLASVTDPGADGNLAVSAIEGTNVLSTGESGGSKFLREDGDGSCSFQPAGKILQVVGNSIDSVVVLGTSYTNVISKEITGVLASSRILVIVSGGGAGYNSSTISCDYKITRGSSESDTTIKEYDDYANLEGSGQWRPCPISLLGLDESPSTGNITYTVWGKKSGGSYWAAYDPNMTIFEISA